MLYMTSYCQTEFRSWQGSLKLLRHWKLCLDQKEPKKDDVNLLNLHYFILRITILNFWVILGFHGQIHEDDNMLSIGNQVLKEVHQDFSSIHMQYLDQKIPENDTLQQNIFISVMIMRFKEGEKLGWGIEWMHCMTPFLGICYPLSNPWRLSVMLNLLRLD